MLCKEVRKSGEICKMKRRVESQKRNGHGSWKQLKSMYMYIYKLLCAEVCVCRDVLVCARMRVLMNVCTCACVPLRGYWRGRFEFLSYPLTSFPRDRMRRVQHNCIHLCVCVCVCVCVDVCVFVCVLTGWRGGWCISDTLCIGIFSVQYSIVVTQCTKSLCAEST